jgi:hypothetical protein
MHQLKVDYTQKVQNRWYIERYKARPLCRSFEQLYGSDYFSSFASVIRYTTLEVLRCEAAVDDLETVELDVNAAFLNPSLDEEFYMEIPEFFELIYHELICKRGYLRLLKSLYGLKQAPRVYFEEVEAYLKSIGLRATHSDPNPFVDKYKGSEIKSLLYVGDMLIMGKLHAATAIVCYGLLGQILESHAYILQACRSLYSLT